MSRWKAIRYGLVGIILLINISLGLYLFSITNSNDKIRSAYLERAYYIYSNEIYPFIEELDIQELYSNTSDSVVSFMESLGLNSLCGEDKDLFKVSFNGDTNLYFFVRSMVDKVYLIVNPDSYSGALFEAYKAIPAEDFLQSIKKNNQQIKDALDAELGKGHGFIDAFESIEPFLQSG